MSNPNFKTFFNKISEEEKLNKISQIIFQRGEVQIWEKKSPHREKYKVIGGAEQDLILHLTPFVTESESEPESKLVDRPVLVNLVIDSIQYFSTSQLLKTGKEQYSIRLKEDIFKCEKRGSFRLQADNLHKIVFTANGVAYSALDVSIGGTSFLVKTAVKEQFPVGHIFEKAVIEFNGAKYEISQSQIVRQVDRPNTQAGKEPETLLGIKFLKITSDVDTRLCRQINTEMYKLFNPFEKS